MLAPSGSQGSSPRPACPRCAAAGRLGTAAAASACQAGLLLQVDGSQHDCLEGRGPWLTLVGGINGATGRVTGATFREQEDSAGYLEVLVQTARAYGLPLIVKTAREQSGILTTETDDVRGLITKLRGPRPAAGLGLDPGQHDLTPPA